MDVEPDPPPDVAIAASAGARELRFHSRPEVRVRYPGTGERDSAQTTSRRNLPSPVEPGTTYRRVSVATRIESRLRSR